MFCLSFLTVFADLTNVATFIPTSNALPAPDTAIIPRGPNALMVHEPRQGEIVADIIMEAIWGIADAVGKGAQLQKIFGNLLGDNSKTCCTNDLPTCRFNAGKTKAGHGFYACFIEGDAVITDDDVNAMKCMINLHFLQPDKCIDFKGSVCANAYPSGGLMNDKVDPWFTHHRDNANKLSAQDSETLQGAAETMKGTQINYAKGGDSAIKVAVVDDKDGTLAAQVDFAGHPGDDC